jgi:outer membrane biosynthesis protein TonB
VVVNEPEPEEVEEAAPEPKEETETEEAEETTDETEETDTDTTETESKDEEDEETDVVTTKETVETTANLRVREQPYGRVIGIQRHGSAGEKRAERSSTQVRGYNWVYVDFDNGVDGYVADSFLSTRDNTVNQYDYRSLNREAKIKLIKELLERISDLRALLNRR